jgi:hypothetical protein
MSHILRRRTPDNATALPSSPSRDHSARHADRWERHAPIPDRGLGIAIPIATPLRHSFDRAQHWRAQDARPTDSLRPCRYADHPLLRRTTPRAVVRETSKDSDDLFSCCHLSSCLQSIVPNRRDVGLTHQMSRALQRQQPTGLQARRLHLDVSQHFVRSCTDKRSCRAAQSRSAGIAGWPPLETAEN